MNNTTFSFNKKQIVQSALEPDTHNIWLNTKDNKLYKYNAGWEPICGNNIYRIFLLDNGSSNGIVLDPNHEKENTLARIAFNEDFNKYTNNIYLITLTSKDGYYDEITGIANCQDHELLIADFTTGMSLDPTVKKVIIRKTILQIDSELFKDFELPNEEISFRRFIVSIQADLISY